MINFVILFAVIVAAIIYYVQKRNALIAVVLCGIGLAIVVAVNAASLVFSASSVELISGQVTGKDRHYDPDEETYSCGKDKTCTREIPRWRWDVESDTGDDYSEHTYSKSDVPEIYANARKGEPFARTKMFLNFQYVSDQTISVNKQFEYTGWLPEYPSIYNGYRVDRGISNVVDSSELSKALAQMQRQWGPEYGANVIVTVVSYKASGFNEALRNKWVGGKKNDIVLTLYLDDDKTVKKVELFSRSTSNKHNKEMADFNIMLRDTAAQIGTYDPVKVIPVVNSALPYFEREDLSKYDFLMNDYEAPWFVYVLSVVLAFVAMFFAMVKMEESMRYSYNRRRYF